jgi:DNA-binding transcriptional regulator YiaG
MTPPEFKQAREGLRLDQFEAATLLGYGSRTRISAIENGDKVPKQAAIIMRLLMVAPRKEWPR